MNVLHLNGKDHHPAPLFHDEWPGPGVFAKWGNGQSAESQYSEDADLRDVILDQDDPVARGNATH